MAGFCLHDSTLEPLITRANAGDIASKEQLFQLLYAELRRIADRELRRAGQGALVSPTTILHEAYLSLAGRTIAFPEQSGFLAYASRAMRGLIVDLVRSRRAQKRGGGMHITALDTNVPDAAGANAETEAINAAVEELAVLDARLAELVDLKFFCGFSLTEIAVMRGVSERTVQRDWDKARLLLRQFMDSPLD